MIYFDNAATTLQKPPEVIEAVVRAMQSMGNSGRGVHEASLDAARTIFGAREALADFFHGKDPSRIVFTSNCTESLNIAIKGLLNPGDHVITTVLEHNSVLRPLYEMEEQGVRLTILSSDRSGIVAAEDFEREITSDTKMIVCTHSSNLAGNLLDIKKIGEIARKHSVVFVVDAAQSAGIFDIDVQDMKIDVLCFTGHKSLLGPQGTGGLYVGEGVEIRPLKSGGSGVQTYHKKHPGQLPEALEAGTLNGHGIAGLGAAISCINKIGLADIRKKEIRLMRRFYEGIQHIPGIKIYGDFSHWERCPIVTINLGEKDSGEVGDELYMTYGIAVRSGAHCAPLMHQALGTKEQGAVRFSFSYCNTEEEVDIAVEALKNIAADIG